MARPGDKQKKKGRPVGSTTKVKKPTGSQQPYRKASGPPAPKVAHALRTPAGKKISNAQKKKATAALTAEAVIAHQLKGIKSGDNTLEPYMLKPSHVVNGLSLPTYPSPEIITAMAHLVKQGSFPVVAARALGVSAALFEEWVQKGFEDPSSVFGQMIAALDIADAQDEITDIQMVTAGVRSWAALAWKRERKSAKRWGLKGRQDGGVPMEDYVTPKKTASKQIPDANTAATILETLEALGALSILNVAEQTGIDPSLVNAEEPEDADADD